MSFVPRLEAPSSSSPYWRTTGSGGYNKCINISGGSTIPNCVGYAYGRFMEIMQATSCNLSTNNAGKWYGNTSDGYARSDKPQLGAVICWDHPGQAGHVAIVEKINSDGSIVTSNSAYNGKLFYTQTLNPPNYTWSSNYKLQGFICNPSVSGNNTIGQASKLSLFLQTAKSQIGKKQDWVRSVINCGDIEWCAAFVCACAKIAGVLDVIIPNSYGCGTLLSTGVSKGWGTFLKGPWFNCNVIPQAGDLITFRRNRGYTDEYSCSHIGIVTGCDGSTVYTVEGNTVTYDRHTSSIKDKSYGVSYECIHGYYRPNWSVVGASAGDWMLGGGAAFSLYNTQNTREDAMIREIGYLDNDYKPSISTSKIKLSVINYTSKLAEVFSQITVAYGGFGDVMVDGIDDPNARTIIAYLVGKGLNAAAACGVCGNVKHESGYKTDAVGDYGTSFGICQWHNERGTNMKSFVGSDWATNLTGQLDFLWNDLTSLLPSTLKKLQAVPNTVEGAKRAADVFVREFERPAQVDTQSALRQATAAGLFSSCVIQQSTAAGGGVASQVTTQSGGTPSNPKTITIPANVNQSGITANYTNYTYFYTRWARSSIQRKLADIWNQQGRPSDRNIATINGYYLCAVTLTIGTTGDLITVVLQDGTSFNCIIADSKGANPGLTGESGNQFGHSFGNGTIDVIEWEKKGSAASGTDNHTQIDLKGWKGKKVAKILNYGTFLK